VAADFRLEPVLNAAPAEAAQGVRTVGLVAESKLIGAPILAGEQGFEPQLPDPESGVLPLDDSPVRAGESITL
jgi:hypothetical protein